MKPNKTAALSECMRTPRLNSRSLPQCGKRSAQNSEIISFSTLHLKAAIFGSHTAPIFTGESVS
ncbi:MAG: hypothetical protein IJ876_05115 [Elusimicrobiaceae bacterium]|nr:hypothetical protein [Elusimicrobiaceae bacterium]